MPKRPPLTTEDKEKIYRAILQGSTVEEAARLVGCSRATARKWWRRGRDQGLVGLQSPPMGSPLKGILSAFDLRVAQKALACKQAHPKWGADRVLIELAHDPELVGLDLPARRTLTTFFKDRCPELLSPIGRREKKITPKPPKAKAVHEIWQLDTKEGIRLSNGQIASICNIRDPFSGAMIASRAFSVKSSKHWRKLNLDQVRSVLRQAFCEWQTLPDALQTDNELGLSGSPTDSYPSRLTLWLRGLGVAHLFIRPHTPTDQAQVERNHRTLCNFALCEVALSNLDSLQESLDRERHLYNYQFPARASGCAGRPPIVAYPQLLTSRRHYRAELELVLFDIQRVYDYLAEFTFSRKISRSGQVSLGRRMYSVGRKHADLSVEVRFDACKAQWLFSQKSQSVPQQDQSQASQHSKLELARRQPRDLDFESLSGLAKAQFQPAPPIQLAFPTFL